MYNPMFLTKQEMQHKFKYSLVHIVSFCPARARARSYLNYETYFFALKYSGIERIISQVRTPP